MTEAPILTEEQSREHSIAEIKSKIDALVKDRPVRYYGKGSWPYKAVKMEVSSSLIRDWRTQAAELHDENFLVMENPQMIISTFPQEKVVVERKSFLGLGGKSHVEVQESDPSERRILLDIVPPTDDVICRYILVLPSTDRSVELQLHVRNKGSEDPYKNILIEPSTRTLEMFSEFMNVGRLIPESPDLYPTSKVH